MTDAKDNGADLDLEGLRFADLPDLMTEREAARVMRIHWQTLRNRRFRLIREPDSDAAPEFVRIGNRIHYKKTTVQAWLDRHEGAIPSTQQLNREASEGGAA